MTDARCAATCQEEHHANSLLLGSFSGPCLVLLKDPLDIPNGFILRQFDPLCMRIRVETLGTEFHLQTNPQNMTTKHYDTLGQLRLVSERIGCPWVFDPQTLPKFMKLLLKLFLVI